MVTAVDICNLALARCGDKATITGISPSDGSTQANLCATFYPMARELLLDSHEWAWNTKYEALTLQTFTDTTVTSDRGDWTFGYLLPTGHLKNIAILPPATLGQTADGILSLPDDWRIDYSPWTSQPYEIALDEDDDQVLYTDVEDAVARYTIYVTDPQVFPPTFTEALAWKLAALLAGALLRDANGVRLGQYCEAQAQRYLDMAKANDANSSKRRNLYVPGSIQARY